MEITKVYPLDAVFDNLDEVPEDVKKKSLGFFLFFTSEFISSCFLCFFLEIFTDKNKQAVRRIH